MGYEGHLQPLTPGTEKDYAVRAAIKLLVDSKELIERAGIPVGIVSCGGTGDYQVVGQYPGVTEHQAGSYLLMDSWYAPFAPDFRPALSVLVTVISKTAGKRIVVDAGVKAISGEGPPRGKRQQVPARFGVARRARAHCASVTRNARRRRRQAGASRSVS